MVQLQANSVTSSTTFSNPVYEMEESSDAQSMKSSSVIASSDSAIASRAHSFASVDMKPERSSSVIGKFLLMHYSTILNNQTASLSFIVLLFNEINRPISKLQ